MILAGVIKRVIRDLSRSWAKKILDHLGLSSQAPPLARASAPGEELACDPGPDYTAADPTPED